MMYRDRELLTFNLFYGKLYKNKKGGNTNEVYAYA